MRVVLRIDDSWSDNRSLAELVGRVAVSIQHVVPSEQLMRAVSWLMLDVLSTAAEPAVVQAGLEAAAALATTERAVFAIESLFQVSGGESRARLRVSVG